MKNCWMIPLLKRQFISDQCRYIVSLVTKTVLIELLFFTFAAAQTTTPRTVIGLSLTPAAVERGQKPYLLAGENVELQVVVFNALTHQPDSLDAPLYVDWIDNRRGKLLHQFILKPKRGLAHVKLIVPDSLPSGYYGLRAYTNWMRNFSADAFGKMNVLVVAPTFRESIPLKLVKSTVTQVNVCPEGGVLMANLLNNLIICTKDTFDHPVSSPGFISDSGGNVLMRFQTDSAGLATLEFTPQQATPYWIQAGQIRQSLVPTQLTGSVLRCDNVTFPDRIRVTVQNQYGEQQDSLTLLVQSRGKVSAYIRIPKQAPVRVVYLPRHSLSEGIITISLVNQRHELLNERMVYLGTPPGPDLNSWSWLNAELDEPIRLTDAHQISQALVLRRNVLFSWFELTKVQSYKFAAEQGIRLSGQITKANHKPLIQPVTVSLFAQPVEPDPLRQEQLLFTETDATGRFSFQDLIIYGTYKAILSAKVGQSNALVTLDSVSGPAIQAQVRPIDWSLLIDQKEQHVIEAGFTTIQAQTQRTTRLAGITLQSVTVKASLTPTGQRKFVTPPTVRLDQAKVLTGGVSNLDVIFSRYVKQRETKLGGKGLVLVDDVPIRSYIEIPVPGMVDHIDIYEGTSDAFYYGVDLVVSIYTIFWKGLRNAEQSGKQIKLVGFDRGQLTKP